MADCDKPRQDRLAAALRDNLKRRKAAARTAPAQPLAGDPSQPLRSPDDPRR